MADAPDSAGIDFFGGSNMPPELSIAPEVKETPKKEAKADADKVSEPAGDVDVSEDDAEPDADGAGVDDAGPGDDDDEDESEEDEEELEPEPKGTRSERKRPVVIRTPKQDFKIPPTAKVSVRVDGKDEDVPIADLLEGYSSNKGITKRLEEINRFKASVEAEKEKSLAMVRTFAEGSKDPKTAMPALGSLLDEAGVDPLPIVRGLRSSIVETVLNWLQTPEDTRNAIRHRMQWFETQEEAHYYKTKVEKQNESQKNVANNSKLMSEVNRVMKEREMPDMAAFERSFRALQGLNTEGKLRMDDITPDDVGVFHYVMSVVETDFPELKNDSEAKGKLMRLAREFNPSKEELVTIIRGYTGSDKEQVRAKPSKARTTKPSGPKPSKLEDLFI